MRDLTRLAIPLLIVVVTVAIGWIAGHAVDRAQRDAALAEYRLPSILAVVRTTTPPLSAVAARTTLDWRDAYEHIATQVKYAGAEGSTEPANSDQLATGLSAESLARFATIRLLREQAAMHETAAEAMGDANRGARALAELQAEISRAVIDRETAALIDASHDNARTVAERGREQLSETRWWLIGLFIVALVLAQVLLLRQAVALGLLLALVAALVFAQGLWRLSDASHRAITAGAVLVPISAELTRAVRAMHRAQTQLAGVRRAYELPATNSSRRRETIAALYQRYTAASEVATQALAAAERQSFGNGAQSNKHGGINLVPLRDGLAALQETYRQLAAANQVALGQRASAAPSAAAAAPDPAVIARLEDRRAAIDGSLLTLERRLREAVLDADASWLATVKADPRWIATIAGLLGLLLIGLWWRSARAD